MDDWRKSEVENQIRFRDFNEWIESSNDRMGDRRPMEDFICECGDADCREPIHLTRGEYETVRTHGDRFAIALDHENPETDRVLEQNERFATSEKLPGLGGRRSLATDPRRVQAQA